MATTQNTGLTDEELLAADPDFLPPYARLQRKDLVQRASATQRREAERLQAIATHGRPPQHLTAWFVRKDMAGVYFVKDAPLVRDRGADDPRWATYQVGPHRIAMRDGFASQEAALTAQIDRLNAKRRRAATALAKMERAIAEAEILRAMLRDKR